jgi:hypothetical protein
MRMAPVTVDQDRAHTRAPAPLDVPLRVVADEHALFAGDAEQPRRVLEDPRRRLAPADVAAEYDLIDERG